jgi:hypothetical protein
MNGFDDIINALDKRLEPSAEIKLPEPKHAAPTFNVGDVIVIRETRWPAETGKILLRTGLYSSPGFPRLADLELPPAETEWEFNPHLHQRLKENLAGTLTIGDVCKIHAVWCCEDDDKWYYFVDNGKSNGKGWTRCSFRFRKAEPHEAQRRQR